jgi:hypothetical protein
MPRVFVAWQRLSRFAVHRLNKGQLNRHFCITKISSPCACCAFRQSQRPNGPRNKSQKGNDQWQPNDHERRVNALSYSHAKAIDATSDVTKPVNSRKRLTWADHLRQIGAERRRQKWPRARAIVATANAGATSLDASYES